MQPNNTQQYNNQFAQPQQIPTNLGAANFPRPANVMTSVQKQGGKFSIVTMVLSVLAIISISAAGVFGYLYFQERGKVAGITTDQVIADVKGIVHLESDEKPDVYPLSEIEKLKQQNPDFYKEARNGDALVVFKENEKALIYRIESKKIINITKAIKNDTKDPQGKPVSAPQR